MCYSLINFFPVDLNLGKVILQIVYKILLKSLWCAIGHNTRLMATQDGKKMLRLT